MMSLSHGNHSHSPKTGGICLWASCTNTNTPPQKELLCSQPCSRIKDNAGLRSGSLEENINGHTFLFKIICFVALHTQWCNDALVRVSSCFPAQACVVEVRGESGSYQIANCSILLPNFTEQHHPQCSAPSLYKSSHFTAIMSLQFPYLTQLLSSLLHTRSRKTSYPIARCYALN